MQTFYFSFCIFSILADSRNQLCLVGSHMPVSGYIYTGQASMDMDISMDIHAKSVDMDMDTDGKFHIHGNPGVSRGRRRQKIKTSRAQNSARSLLLFLYYSFQIRHPLQV